MAKRTSCAVVAELASTRGVVVSCETASAKLTPACLQNIQSSGWAADAGCRALAEGAATSLTVHPLSTLLRMTELTAAAALWHAGDPRQRSRMLECGGPGTGTTWTSVPDTAVLRWPDAHWRCATRFRLALPLAPLGTTCSIPRADGSLCGCAVDTFGVHLSLCKAGPARLRPHTALARRLGMQLRAVRGFVDYERPVPDLFTVDPHTGAISEAVLDIVCTFPGATSYHAVDVSIRSPDAERYGTADIRPGAAAASGEADKLRRYGPTVLPVVIETGGRMGLASIDALASLATEARLACNVSAGRPLWCRWRTELESAALFALSDVALLGLGDAASTLLPARRLRTAAHRAATARVGDARASDDLSPADGGAGGGLLG